MKINAKDAFAIYKKGQGVWARSVSAACLVAFLIWGCVELHRSPSLTQQIGTPEQLLDAALIDQMQALGVMEVQIADGTVLLLENVEVDKKLTLKGPATYRTWWANAAFTIPFVEVIIANGHMMVLAVFLPVAYLIFFMGNRPRVANFLIETELELKKVSWSTKKEVIASSKVVFVFVIVTAGLLWMFDTVYRQVVRVLVEIF